MRRYQMNPVLVRCHDCDKQFDETKVDATGIEEDDMGRDVLSFICPICKTDQKSHRFG